MADEEDDRLRAADRNWDELLGELRVVLTGVAVLFSVLLTIPFSAEFGTESSGFQKWVYLTAVLSAAGSAVALIAPVAYHRIGYEREEKPRVVAESNRLVIAGLALLAMSVTAVLLLVLNALVSRPLALLVAGLVGVAAVVLWFVPALARSRRAGGTG